MYNQCFCPLFSSVEKEEAPDYTPGIRQSGNAKISFNDNDYFKRVSVIFGLSFLVHETFQRRNCFTGELIFSFVETAIQWLVLTNSALYREPEICGRWRSKSRQLHQYFWWLFFKDFNNFLSIIIFYNNLHVQLYMYSVWAWIFLILWNHFYSLGVNVRG